MMLLCRRAPQPSLKVPLRMQAYTAGGMAGRVDHIKVQITQLQVFFIAQKNIGIRIPVAIEFMDENPGPRSLLKSRNCPCIR
jgi:hypothetical protein